jgi:Uma2 family endonuclease
MLMTPEEFDAVTDYDDEFRYELIRGLLVVNPVPAEAEADPNDELGAMLRTYQHEDPRGAIVDATLPERYIRTSNGRRRADRVIWAGLGRRPDAALDVPTIAIEFVSASRRDRLREYVERRREYQEAGVVEHWIVDRFHRQMIIFRHSGGETAEVRVGEAETYTTPLLPGFELVLAPLLAAADRWA